MQQATVNLFADMGAQPATLMSGLTAATASTDTVGADRSPSPRRPPARPSPGAQVTSPAPPPTPAAASVAGVEVSTDGGATWHPATGTTRGRTSSRVRPGTQDRARPGRRRQRNIGQSPASRVFTLTGPNTLFGDRVPGRPGGRRRRRVELGVRVHARRPTAHHRRAVLQGHRQHRHAHRHAVVGGGTRWPPARSAARRPPAGRR
jgi:hypothetical protein